jgi:hypothetical protein
MANNQSNVNVSDEVEDDAFIIGHLAGKAFRKLDSYVRRSMITESDGYRTTIKFVENYGHRIDRWAVLAVSFSPQDDQRIIVVPVRWVHVIRNRNLLVCVPNASFNIPDEEVQELPKLTWRFYPVVFCPNGGVVHETLHLALKKRSRIMRL